MYRYTPQQMDTYARIKAALANAPAPTIPTTTVADLSAFIEADRARALAVAELQDSIMDLLLKEARGPKPYRRTLNRDERWTLLRKAGHLAHAVFAAEGK